MVQQPKLLFHLANGSRLRNGRVRKERRPHHRQKRGISIDVSVELNFILRTSSSNMQGFLFSFSSSIFQH